MNLTNLKTLLLQKNPAFWDGLAAQTRAATGFEELMALSTLRRKAIANGFVRSTSGQPALRLAVLGGYSLYPLRELLTHLLETAGAGVELFVGEYDNYAAEIMDAGSTLKAFRPQLIFLLPGPQRCKHARALTDERRAVHASAEAVASQLMNLCRVAHERWGAELVLGNFMLPARHDLGAFRSRAAASPWNFRKLVNLELGLTAPSYVRICDLEFLANRHGALAAEDARGWFESKQPCSPVLLVELCREAARLVLALRQPPKKVLVLDLDNTLWGGIVAEDGIEGIEIGDTSPRGEAFKAFQQYIASLKERGVLLAICSKNNLERVREVFEKHPEMVLRPSDFVAFKANWEPKSDNLHQMAAELKLGLDSFVFVDDSPAEIEIVRQFAPQVTTILLGPDPSEYVGQLQDCRLFEPHTVTAEDLQRTGQYHAEVARESLRATAADMDSYLESLAMKAVICEFRPVDTPRLAQLINRSNQFNLTTRRRTEAEVQALIGHPDYICFSVRLADRFGDHGLISIVIGHVRGEVLEIDTWLMSCRVLKRQVETTVLNELVRLARLKHCAILQGVYLPTAKNDMVREFYPRMGFQPRVVTPERGEFVLTLESYQPRPTKIEVTQRTCESN